MTQSTDMDGLICRAIELGDFVRRPRHRLADRGGYKEWFHFCMCSDSLDAIVNFNVGDPCSDVAAAAQLTCAVRTASWEGSIEQFDPLEVSAIPGRHRVRTSGR